MDIDHGQKHGPKSYRYISHYLMHRYIWTRPHQYNDELTPAQTEKILTLCRDQMVTAEV